MKSWYPSLPFFKTFVIVIYFSFRRLAKRDGAHAAAYAQPNDYPEAAAYAYPDVITRYRISLNKVRGH